MPLHQPCFLTSLFIIFNSVYIYQSHHSAVVFSVRHFYMKLFATDLFAFIFPNPPFRNLWELTSSTFEGYGMWMCTLNFLKNPFCIYLSTTRNFFLLQLWIRDCRHTFLLFLEIASAIIFPHLPFYNHLSATTFPQFVSINTFP